MSVHSIVLLVFQGMVLLFALVVGLPISLFLKRFIRQTPEFAKMWVKYFYNGKWWFYLLGFFLFLVYAWTLIDAELYVFAGLIAIMAVVELYAMLRYGFKRLTPEQIARIDACDPTQFKLFGFWGQFLKVANQESGKTQPSTDGGP